MIGNSARDGGFGVPTSPEERDVFRWAQLLILLEVAESTTVQVKTIDQLGYYDFFAANPFSVVGNEDARDKDDRVSLRLAGFSEKQLSYASTGDRFASRRRKLQYDLAQLVAYGLVHVHGAEYKISASGETLASQLDSVYADAYRSSARIILRRLGRLSARGLNDTVQRVLGQSWLLIDFLDDVADPIPGDPGRSGSRG